MLESASSLNTSNCKTETRLIPTYAEIRANNHGDERRLQGHKGHLGSQGNRIGSIQSAVEAAAVKKSHDYYITSLTEGYKEQLEAMEQGYEGQIKELEGQLAASIKETEENVTKKAMAEEYEERIKDLKSKLAASIESMKKITIKKAVTEEYEERIKTLKSQLAASVETATKDASEKAMAAAVKFVAAEKSKFGTTERELLEPLNARVAAAEHRAAKAEWTVGNLEQRLRSELQTYQATLDKVQKENKTGPYCLLEIKFIKRMKTGMGKPRIGFRRGSEKFSELVASVPTLDKYGWAFEHKGSAIRNTNVTLVQVSLVLDRDTTSSLLTFLFSLVLKTETRSSTSTNT